MRQTTLTTNLRLSGAQHNGAVSPLLDLLENEDELVFHAIIKHGSTLKSISELLVRCSPRPER